MATGRFAAILTVLLAGLLAALPARAAEKVALVIGNGAYANVGALENPRNDAADIAAALERLGFDVVLRLDLDFPAMRRELGAFRARALGAGQAVIYYAGHGIEVDKRNYLIPVDARLRSDGDVNFEALPLDLVVLAADGAQRLSLVIVDACRDNPFLREMTRGSRAIGRGLAAYEPAPNPAGNTVIAYSAKEGTTALDGEGARNSPYARALIETLDQPGVEVGKLFRRVRDRVLELTAGEQEPFYYASLSGADTYLGPPPSPEPAPVAAGRAVEVAFWNSIAASDDRRDFEDYLARYPNGAFASLAARHLEGLAPPRPVGDAAPPQAAPAAPAALPPAPEAQPPAFRPTRAQVRDLQQRLRFLGYDAGPVDGIFGPRTARAVAAYQRRTGQPPDGRITEPLIAALQNLVTPEMPSAHVSPGGRAGAHPFDGKWRVTVDSMTGCKDNSPRSFPVTVRNGRIDMRQQPYPKSGAVSPEGDLRITVTDRSGNVQATQEAKITGDVGKGRFQGQKPSCVGAVTMARVK